MPVATAKIDWPAYVANRTVTRLFQLMRDFLTGNGWTVLTDESSAATPYIVVTYNRNTGFTGDDPIVQLLSGTSGSNYTITARPWESWNTTTKTGTNVAGATGAFTYSLTYDSEIWLSCAPEFILMSGLYQSGTGDGHTIVTGVTCMERLVGDQDTGTFYGSIWYGTFGHANGPRFYVPKNFVGTTGSNAYYSTFSELGYPLDANYLGGLHFTDESDSHVIFSMGAHSLTYGRLKGKLYGLALSTNISPELPVCSYLPNNTTPEWLVTKHSNNNGTYAILMQVSSTITVLS